MAAVYESPVVSATACASCGSDGWTVELTDLADYLTHEKFSIFQCKHCHLQMTHPLPAGSEIGRYYPVQYRGNRHAFTGKIRSTLRRRSIESQLGKNFRGRLLDIGCGDGSFALDMKAHGWDVSVTEIDPHTIQRLSASGIHAKLSHEAQTEGFDESFDAVTCWHVMEHVEHPRQLADWVQSHLLPNGIFQTTVPNVDSLQAKIFGRQWVHLDVPRHRQHFTPATLRSLLEAAHFRIEHQSNFAVEYDWFGVIQSALNLICSRPNVLFNILTHASIDPARPVALTDKLISLLLTPPIALISLPMIATAALVGNGATLTYTCKSR